MKATLRRFGILTPLALSLAACGGGGGSSDGYEAVSPIRGVDMATIANRTGITHDRPQAVPNAVAIINNIEGHANARLVIRESVERQGGQDEDPVIFMQIDQNGDGVYDGPEDWSSDPLNLNPHGNPISAITGQPIVITDTLTRGGAEMVMAEHVPDFRSRTTVYVPASTASDMYGGMYITSRDGGTHFNNAQGAVATWGRNITAQEFVAARNTELNAQDGRATYSGVAEAIVSGAAGDESGRYRDHNASGEINFATNNVTTSANMTGVENPGSSMSVTTSMTYNADGSINAGSATISGLSVGTMAGTSTGEIYGPNADTLGVVFNGADAGDARVVGGMLLNRTDD